MKKLILFILVIVVCIFALNYKVETEVSNTTTVESEPTYPISLQTTDDYTMIDSSPYMALYANGQAFTEDVNDFIDAYNSMPDWLRAYCTEVYLENDENFQTSMQQFDSNIENSVGHAYADGQGNRYVYIKLRYKNKDGKPVLDFSESYKSVIAHELGHHYDFYNGIVKSYDTTVLENNWSTVCDATETTNCQDSLKEAFANAMNLYINNPDALPQEVRTWIDSMPK